MTLDTWKIGRWRGTVFAVFFAVIALAAVFAHRAYAPAMLLPLIAVDWKKALSRGGLLRRKPTRPWLIFIASAGLFTLWGAISLTWTPMPERGDWVLRYLAVFTLAALAFHGGTYLTPAARLRAAKALAWGTLAMAMLLAFEAASGGLLRRLTPPAEILPRDYISLGRGALLLMLLIWPARRVFAAEMGRPLIGWLTVALSVIPALTFTIETNFVMLLVGALFFALSRATGPRMVDVALYLFIAFIWITPLLAFALPLDSLADAATSLPDSWRQRLHIYNRAGAEIAAHGFGGGIEYARSLSRPMQTVVINGVALNTMPIHPHNLFLHVWMDLGLPGAVSLTGLVLAVRASLARVILTRSEAAMIAAITAALLATALTEWSLWQVWRIASVWIAIIACRLAVTTTPDHALPR